MASPGAEAPPFVPRAPRWHEANQRFLVAALAVLGRRLEGDAGPALEAAQAELTDAETAMSSPPALLAVSSAFGLSPFERDLLLLCAGVELDAEFASRCARAGRGSHATAPTFGLALATLPDAHWSAIGPGAPLRRFGLIEVGAGPALTQSPLRIDEHVLHHLAGVRHPDQRLACFVEPVDASGELVPSHQEVAARIVASWRHAAAAGTVLPVVSLTGDERAAKRAAAAAACAEAGLELDRLRAVAIPADADVVALGHTLARSAVLGRRALLVDCTELDAMDPARRSAVARLLERCPDPLFVVPCEGVALPERATVEIQVRRPTAAEQSLLLLHQLGSDAAQSLPRGAIERLVESFDPSTSAIRSACSAAAAADVGSGEGLEARLRSEFRAAARSRMGELAQRIAPAASWHDLVLPAAQQETLRQIALRVRHRTTVHERWGFAQRGARDLGIGALFAGASGTGKTMAAEVLAGELDLDLYRVDLSQIVSKYVGETEKNLRRVFDAAEQGAAILLFDEADALFARRSEVRDSHDRYANVEVGYLLQRMDAYRGLSILTTNLKEAIDRAFLRRLRFVVDFPFPGAVERAEMWRRAFPVDAPTDGLDVARLARMVLTGASIRNTAVAAAFLAADAGEPVRMDHVLDAARAEYAKLERPFEPVL